MRLNLPVLIAVALLVMPTLFLLIRRIVESGFRIPNRPLSAVMSGLGMCALAYLVFTTISTSGFGLAGFEALTLRSFLLFAITGVALAVVTFPAQATQASSLQGKLEASSLRILFVAPAWLLIAIVVALASTQHGI